MLYASSVLKSRLEWLNKGRLALGKITILDGDPGLGKSTMMLDWIARITTGRALPGDTGWTTDEQVTTPRGVVLLSAEDDDSDTIVPRLELAGANTKKVLLLKMVDNENNEYLPTIGRGLWAIEQAIEAANAVLLVIDPFMAYLDAETNSNRDQDVRRVLSPVAAMAARNRCCVLVSRHLNKATGMAGMYRGGGSIGIIGAARIGLLAHKDGEDPTGQRRLLMVQKANLGPEALTLVYRLNGVEGSDHARVEWLGESSITAASVMDQPMDRYERDDASEAERWLEDFLIDGPMPANEIHREATKAGHGTRAIKRAKTALTVKLDKRGFGKDSTWVWSLPVRHIEPVDEDWSAD
jgi:hypothetical protein